MHVGRSLCPLDLMDSRPLLYELNTRCWLQEWGVREGRAVTLADVPVEEFARWRRQGFSHVWLMGAWTNGPLSREVFLRGGDLGAHLDEALPGWTKEDIAGSPYAIQKYTVPAALGGEAGLRRVRRELNRAGLRLLLDFVPNHLGLDHPWAGQHPDWFMPGEPGADGSFEQTTVHGPRWLSHGRDPWFPAWADTVQVDIRRPQPRAALIRDLAMIQERCDGVRCDMAMLLLSDVFSRTWAGHPLEGPGAAGEFWGEVMDTCRRPGFTFLAEVYWDLEERLQELGFDFTYDKKVTDHVMTGDGAALQRHLQGKSAGHLQRSVHFLENHDEPRVAGRLGGPRTRQPPCLFWRSRGWGSCTRASVRGLARAPPCIFAVAGSNPCRSGGLSGMTACSR